jgi:hypothetical protein
MSSDSKYPWHAHGGYRAEIVPYAYDPELDASESDVEDMSWDDKELQRTTVQLLFSPRGIATVSMMLIIALAFLSLLIAFPVVTYFQNTGIHDKIALNMYVNMTAPAT